MAGRDQLPSFERDNTVRTMRKVQIVSDVNGSQAAGSMQFVQQIHDHFAGFKVKAASGFVG